ncbi:hypothetical protein VNO80_11812 [Phaseolus coccineus]|uniref:Uncharacterized protein n=1 Tax=Phaseolus coccineus TaxID=3886 RepID=A0AAN9RKS8_PHACN
MHIHGGAQATSGQNNPNGWNKGSKTQQQHVLFQISKRNINPFRLVSFLLLHHDEEILSSVDSPFSSLSHSYSQENHAKPLSFMLQNFSCSDASCFSH